MCVKIFDQGEAIIAVGRTHLALTPEELYGLYILLKKYYGRSTKKSIALERDE